MSEDLAENVITFFYELADGQGILVNLDTLNWSEFINDPDYGLLSILNVTDESPEIQDIETFTNLIMETADGVVDLDEDVAEFLYKLYLRRNDASINPNCLVNNMETLVTIYDGAAPQACGGAPVSALMPPAPTQVQQVNTPAPLFQVIPGAATPAPNFNTNSTGPGGLFSSILPTALDQDGGELPYVSVAVNDAVRSEKSRLFQLKIPNGEENGFMRIRIFIPASSEKGIMAPLATTIFPDVSNPSQMSPQQSTIFNQNKTTLETGPVGSTVTFSDGTSPDGLFAEEVRIYKTEDGTVVPTTEAGISGLETASSKPTSARRSAFSNPRPTFGGFSGVASTFPSVTPAAPVVVGGVVLPPRSTNTSIGSGPTSGNFAPADAVNTKIFILVENFDSDAKYVVDSTQSSNGFRMIARTKGKENDKTFYFFVMPNGSVKKAKTRFPGTNSSDSKVFKNPSATQIPIINDILQYLRDYPEVDALIGAGISAQPQQVQATGTFYGGVQGNPFANPTSSNLTPTFNQAPTPQFNPQSQFAPSATPAAPPSFGSTFNTAMSNNTAQNLSAFAQTAPPTQVAGAMEQAQMTNPGPFVPPTPQANQTPMPMFSAQPTPQFNATGQFAPVGASSQPGNSFMPSTFGQ